MDLRPVERLLLVYLAFTSLLGLHRLSGQPAIVWVIVANLLSIALVVLLTSRQYGPVGSAIREVHPILLTVALYPALDILNGFGAISVHDATVRAWELQLFGAELSRTWWQAMPSRFWSLVFHGAYFAYYPIVAAPILLYLGRGQQADLRRAMLWLLTAYLTCYTVFLLYPVAGPYYEFPRPAAWFLDNPMARLVYGTLDKGSAYGAAFPSSHVAATLVATAAAFRGSRALGWILLLPATLLVFGVVYCQMHYAVDALAGLGLGALTVAVGLWLEKDHGSEPTRR